MSTIIDCLRQYIVALDNMLVFPDFPQVSLLRMIIGIIIISILLSVISGKESHDNDDI